MKLVTYAVNGRTAPGVVQGESVVDISDIAPNILALIDMGNAGLDLVRQKLSINQLGTPLADVHLHAPIPTPRRNVMCLGLNYADHAEESLRTKGLQVAMPEFPVIFNKATTAVNGPYDDIPYDTAVSTQIDWEVELGVVIGRSGKNINQADAMSHVYGYTVINDISARDLQRQHQQFFKGKSLDGSCPMGPWLVTADEIPDPHTLDVTCRVNGVIKQHSNTRYLIFNIPVTIAHLSKGMTLLAGDIIATGTPSGVGFARTPPEFLQPGDVVESEISHIGVIHNQITG